jgi:glycosyltransferase involved in cell wall biosynthesis
MRVLHIHSGNLYGGVETLLVTLARHRDLSPQMESHFALCFEGLLSEQLRASGVPVHHLGHVKARQPLSVWRARRELQQLLQREKVDLAICHSAWSQAMFGKVVRQAHLPLVFWLHDAIDGRHWLQRWAAQTEPDLAVCNSRFTEELLPLMYPSAPTEVLYCPVSSSENHFSEAERAALRAALDTGTNATVIIQIGRMEPLKGHAIHLEALSLLKDLPDWVAWQVGGGQRAAETKYLADLKRLSERLGIAPRVRFLGQRSDVARLLSAADIYCQPNTGPEAFGITFVEALNARVPVITTAIGGAPEIVDDSCGMLVPPNDPAALAKSLETLIRNPVLRNQLGAGGPAQAAKVSNPASRVRQLTDLVSSVIEKAAA